MPSTDTNGADWMCAGCGKPSPNKARCCDCLTSVVFCKGENAWKTEPGSGPDLIKRLKDVRKQLEPHIGSHWLGPIDEAATRIKELEEHNKRLGQGGAERYWENRYRDEAAENERLRNRLKRIGV